ncbi:glucose-6-phosphatase 3 [Xenopus laevis]|uniref:Glucose-6-phosphatase n=2 Tax=Xenopus laevis TaxID=8355 RepID=A0A974H292_XENLA|nr:glucose-6-phosphatase 3 [Xenopus laevis]OCT62208.1 hypothetical protein XELAEV_18043292mg [Xenopus laevis]
MKRGSLEAGSADRDWEMDALHSSGVVLAAYLQEKCLDFSPFWLWVNHLGDPAHIYVIYFPLAYCMCRRLGVALLWTGLLSEWFNLVFKWFLFGERPFWWIREHGQHSDLNLTQFPLTCETGPGSPSGHCMITGAALWPVMMFFTNLQPQRPLWSLVPIILYIMLMVGVAISRVLILAHFPHQVVAGLIAGMCLGHSLPHTVSRGRTLLFFTLTSLLLLFGAFLIYFGMGIFGVDLSWSINLATKWCAKPEWIRLETRPFSSVTRSAASALGLGFALHCPLYNQLCGGTTDWRKRAITLVLSLLLLGLLHRLPLQTDSPLLFYCLNFFRYALCPLTVVIFAPYITHCLHTRATGKEQ